MPLSSMITKHVFFCLYTRKCEARGRFGAMAMAGLPVLVPGASSSGIEVAGPWLSHRCGIFLIPIPAKSTIAHANAAWLLR